jgi:prophage regulatory protein
MPPKATKKPARPPVALPEDDLALVREPMFLAVFPVGSTTLWNGIRSGIYPKPYRISRRVNAWRAGDIRKLLLSCAAEDP